MLKGRNFAYLNFDDGKLLSAWDDDLVWETLHAVYPDFEYLLLDEVQNLDGWHLMGFQTLPHGNQHGYYGKQRQIAK